MRTKRLLSFGVCLSALISLLCYPKLCEGG